MSTIEVGAGAIRRMLEVPGMPFTKTVARAQPDGKLVTGNETNELMDQFVEERERHCPLSMARNCTTGQSLDEFCVLLPPEASDTPRNLDPGEREVAARVEHGREGGDLRLP